MLDPTSFDDISLDQKKLEDDIPYEEFLPDSDKHKSYQEKLEMGFKKGKRADGRTSDESRRMYINLGPLVDARGSCYLEMGETKVLCAVVGPQEIPASQASGYSELGSVVCNFESYPPLTSDKANGDAVKKAIEPVFCRSEFPNLEINISVRVLDGRGSVLSAAITAAGLALAHGRLPIHDVLTSVSLGLHGDLLFVDPTDDEEELCMTPQPCFNENHGLVTVSFLKTAEQICHYHQSGNMDLNFIQMATDLAIKRCQDVYALCQKHLFDDLKSNLKKGTEEVEDSMKTLRVK